MPIRSTISPAPAAVTRLLSSLGRSLAGAPGERIWRWACLLLFLFLVVRFWHPIYGFTRFVQMDAEAIRDITPRLQHTAIFTYHETGGYDGQFYAKIASDPTLRDPDLHLGIDNFPYRARRIAGSWLAHLIAGGDPGTSLRVYAWVNLGAWYALAAVLWLLLPVGNWRHTLAWSVMLFSAGALHSVRFALADLPALTFIAAALLAHTRGRLAWTAALLALATLSRETSLLAAAALALHCWINRQRIAAGIIIVAAGLPLALWLRYVEAMVGPNDGGWSNLGWPVLGLLEKWRDSVQLLFTEPNTSLAVTSLLAVAGLTVAAAFLVRHRRFTDAVWLVGAAYGGLMLTLNTAVWEGFPGAATRVLLPLVLAFCLLAARQAQGWRWLTAGCLLIPAGIIALVPVSHQPGELAAQWLRGNPYLVSSATGFYPVERARGKAFAWFSTEGELRVHSTDKIDAEIALALEMRALAPRRVEIYQDATLRWAGEVGTRYHPVVVPGITVTAGKAVLRLRMDGAPLVEPAASARPLGVAVSRITLH